VGKKGMNSSSWLNGRTLAAGVIIVWAGALHYNMRGIQKQIEEVKAADETKANRTNTKDKVTVNLTTDLDQD
jgi:hypothetical protein